MHCRHPRAYYASEQDSFFCSDCGQDLGTAFYDAVTALQIVSAGIWRDRAMNACGLSGAATAVHAVEKALQNLDEEPGDRT